MIIEKPVTLTRYRLLDPKGNEIPEATIEMDKIEIEFRISEQSGAFAVIKNIPRAIPMIVGAQFDTFKKEPPEKQQQILEEMMTKILGDKHQEVLQSFMPRTLDSDPNGPGTILSGMLSAVGIKSTPNCSCRRRAIAMNANGPEWCEENLGTILEWLREEAGRRKLPFVQSVAKMIVKKAISKSKRLLAKQQQKA
jgi:hypothetical protein